MCYADYVKPATSGTGCPAEAGAMDKAVPLIDAFLSMRNTPGPPDGSARR